MERKTTIKEKIFPLRVFRILVGLFCFGLGLPFGALAMDVTLQWDANAEPDLAGYVIYYKTGHSGDRIKGNYPSHVEVTPAQDENPDPNIVEFTVTNLVDGENYVFVVTAFDDQDPRNESDTSNEASTDNVPPPAVAGLISSHPIYNEGDQCSTDNAVTMYWTESIDPEPGSGLGGYSWAFDGLGTSIPDEYRDLVSGVTSVTHNLDDGLYWFHIRAGDKAGRSGVPNWGEAAHYGAICIDTGAPGVAGVWLISGTTVEITYTETGMKNAAVAGNYTFDNGVVVSGVTDATGENRTFWVSVSNLQSYIIYTMTISANVTDVANNSIPSSGRSVQVNDDDEDGMADDWERLWFSSAWWEDGTGDADGDGLTDFEEYRYAREKWGIWGANWWALNPTSSDSDNDGIPDKYEVDNGLNPTDGSDRDLDLDNDGWTNYEEYLFGYSASNPDSPVPAPPQVKEVIPGGSGPVPSNSVFAVRLEATQGINIAESSGVTVTVNDGIQQPYKRNLDNTTVKAIPLDSGVTTSRNLWVAYYRSNETANEYSSGVTVTVTFEATDVRKDSMTSRSLTFRIQTAEEEQEEADNLPNTVTLPNTPSSGLTTSGVTSTASPLDRAAIIYDSSLPGDTGIIPYFGATEDIPVFDISGFTGVGVAMNLLPPAVFPSGVTVVIPCPRYTNVSGLNVFYHNAQQWVMACDPGGNVQPGGLGWMVPGSRVNHNGNPAWIEIKVYHFSAAMAAQPPATVESGGGGGGGCFISALGGK